VHKKKMRGVGGEGNLGTLKNERGNLRKPIFVGKKKRTKKVTLYVDRLTRETGTRRKEGVASRIGKSKRWVGGG